MMEGIRVVELKAERMVTSGDRPLEEFDQWFSQVASIGADAWFPRDFMWFDSVRQRLIWFFALPHGHADTGGFEWFDFEGGLYAAAISRDEDDKDGERVYAAIRQWVAESGCFALDERPGHETMFHVVTPKAVREVMGYNQLDIYVPIKIQEGTQ